MPISSTDRKASFDGNGIATTFPFAFKVFAKGELVVVKSKDGVDTGLTLDSDYTVTLSSSGGSVVLSTPLPIGCTLTITSAVSATQELDLQNQGGFYPETITKALDKLTILIQQLQQNGVGVGVSAKGMFGGNLTGTKDGANKVFTLTGNGFPLTKTPTQVTVWCNYPLVPGVGYTLGPDPGQVTFTTAPEADDTLFAQGSY